MHHLDRNATFQSKIVAEIDHRHAAAGDPRTDEIPIVERVPDERVGGEGVHGPILWNFSETRLAARRGVAIRMPLARSVL